MSGTVIVLIVIAATYFLGKYAISEGQKIEQHKKFIKNMEKMDKKYKTKTR
tara:strand:- start:18 stop:170 length:153 start_codon:yes stop_codon:yes gene_type:complete